MAKLNKCGRPTFGYYDYQGDNEPLFTDDEVIAISRQKAGMCLNPIQKELLRKMDYLLEEEV
jgi:hypothetical protein